MLETDVFYLTIVWLKIISVTFENFNTIEKKIYNSSVEILINVLQNVDNLYYNICLVGHEPTFSSFIAICSNSSIIKFPTGSMAKIEFEIKKWENINLDKANIQWIKKPKELDI